MRLRFSAHNPDTDEEICDPVFSDPIHNMSKFFFLFYHTCSCFVATAKTETGIPNILVRVPVFHLSNYLFQPFLKRRVINWLYFFYSKCFEYFFGSRIFISYFEIKIDKDCRNLFSSITNVYETFCRYFCLLRLFIWRMIERTSKVLSHWRTLLYL